MADPIDYSGAFAQQTPLQSFAGGYQLGQGIRDDIQQQQALQQQAIDQRAASQRQQEVLQSLIANPRAGAQDYAAASLLIPGLKDQLKQSWEMRNTAQQESNLRDMGQAYSAIVSGRPDIAVKQLQRRADAMEAAGANPAEIQALRTNAQVIEANPEFARTTMGVTLASIPGGDKVLTGISTAGTESRAQQQAPAALAKANAAASIEQVTAANAPAKAALEVTNLAEDVETKRANREIAALETQIKQADSETRRGELIAKRDEIALKRDEAARAKTETTQSKLDKIDLSLSTVDAITKHPAIEGFFFGPGTLAGKVSNYVPGSDRKDLQGLVDTLQAQQFLTGVQNLVGMGALSDAEGKKIGAAVASLDLDQSPKAFKNALGVVKATLEKAQRGALASGTAPTQGGGFVVKHPQFGNVTEGDINRMMASNPGSTREQVLQYLNSTSGKKAQTGGAGGAY